MVEQRQQLGQRGRRAPAVDAEAPLARRRRRRRGRATSSGRRRRRAARRCAGRRRSARSGGTAARYAAGAWAPTRSNRSRASSSPTSGHERRPQAVGPRRRQLVDVPLERLEVDVARRRRRPADADGDAGQRARPEVRLERPLLGAVGLGDGVGDALGQLGGEPVAGQVDEHGRPTGRPARAPRTPAPAGAPAARRWPPRAGPRSSARCSSTRSRGRFSRTVRVARPVCECIRASLRSRASATAVADAGDVEHADPVGVRGQQADEPRVRVARRPRSRRPRPAGRARNTRAAASVRAMTTGRSIGIGRGLTKRGSSRAGRARCRGAA